MNRREFLKRVVATIAGAVVATRIKTEIEEAKEVQVKSDYHYGLNQNASGGASMNYIINDNDHMNMTAWGKWIDDLSPSEYNRLVNGKI